MTGRAGVFPDLAPHERDLAAGPDDASHRAENDALDARIFWLVTERLEETYGADVRFRLRLPRENVPALRAAVADATRGGGTVSELPHGSRR